MVAEIVERNKDSFKLTIEVPYNKSMLQSEELIQMALNEGGVLATREVLSRFDADGSPIVVGNVKFTGKGKVPKVYQSPYGSVDTERHVYQTSKGGRIYCPLEEKARIVGTSTPKFAKMIASKYADMGAQRVMKDLAGNHGRSVVRSFVQDIADLVGHIATAKETTWEYDIPVFDRPVATVSVGMDGTCALLCDDGWRETMVGTLALYDRDGERLHTIYTAAIPEYGKASFMERFEKEIGRLKAKFPLARYVGIADGAKGNWEFLTAHTEVQITDFWHATEYLAKAADAMFRGKKNAEAKIVWLDEARHRLKTVHGAASRLLTEMQKFSKASKMPSTSRESLGSAITYFTNQKMRMKYARHAADQLPIGSGVTEAACKVIVKQRLGGSGMKWAKPGASIVLALRTLVYSEGRWETFWRKADQHGLSLAA